jgi:hypothetical protein
MSVPPAWPQVLDFFGTPLVIEPSAGQPPAAPGGSPSAFDVPPRHLTFDLDAVDDRGRLVSAAGAGRRSVARL